jgi:hypothetical protein
MGVLISLVAIPLREDVPNFSAAAVLLVPWNCGWELLFWSIFHEPANGVQVIEISNT